MGSQSLPSPSQLPTDNIRSLQPNGSTWVTLSPCAVNSSSSSDCLDHPSPMFSFCRHMSHIPLNIFRGYTLVGIWTLTSPCEEGYRYLFDRPEVVFRKRLLWLENVVEVRTIFGTEVTRCGLRNKIHKIKYIIALFTHDLEIIVYQ